MTDEAPSLEAALASAREELERERKKSYAFATMSHEIRTLLTGVIGITQLLLDTDLAAPQRDYAKRIRSSGDALLDVLNHVLDYAKMEQGELPVESTDVDARRVVEEVGELLAERAHERKVELLTHVHASVPQGLRGDPSRLRQVLLNLVSNAIKFTDRGDVQIRVTLNEETDDTALVRFEVRDTGVGIRPEWLPRVFDPFAQGDPGDGPREQGGSGLGLAIAKKLVEAMDGRIGATSELGVGSTFWCTLPFEKRALPPERGVIPRMDMQGRRALVVSGHVKLRALLVEALAAIGLDAYAASDGVSALAEIEAAARRRRVDVVIADAGLPDMDGLSLARAMEQSPASSAPRVILMSYPGDARPQSSQPSNVVAQLAKPVRQAQLAASVRKALGALEEQIGAAALGGTSTSPRRAATGERSVPEPAPSTPHGRPKVLVVDDDLVNQKVTVFMLQKKGFAADVADNGLEAIEAAMRYPYAAILMDCHLPKFDGYQAAAELRTREGKGRRTPIIATTADARPSVRDRCLAAGMDDYLEKPLLGPALERALRKWAGEPQKLAPPSEPMRQGTPVRHPLARSDEAQLSPESTRARPPPASSLRQPSSLRPLLSREEEPLEARRAPTAERSAGSYAQNTAPMRQQTPFRHPLARDDAARPEPPKSDRAAARQATPLRHPLDAPGGRTATPSRRPIARDEEAGAAPSRRPLARDEEAVATPRLGQVALRQATPLRHPMDDTGRSATPQHRPLAREDDAIDASSWAERSASRLSTPYRHPLAGTAPRSDRSDERQPTPLRSTLEGLAGGSAPRRPIAREEDPPEAPRGAGKSTAQRAPAEPGSGVESTRKARSTTPPSALDREVVARLRELEADNSSHLLREVTQIYLADAVSRVDLLRDAAERGDASELTRLAHSLRGSSAQLGARYVEAIAARLEKIGRSGITGGASDLVRILDVELGRVGSAMEAEIAQKSRSRL